MRGGRHSYSWRWNRESKQAESIGLIKLLSSWKTRWAAVALALSLPLLLCLSPLLPTLSGLPSLVTASLLLVVVDGYDQASSAFARNLVSLVNLVAVERGTRCWRPISESFDVLFIREANTVLFAVPKRFSHRERKLEFIVGRVSMIQVLSNRREKNGEAEFFLESCHYPVNDNWIIVDMCIEKKFRYNLWN